MKRPTTKAELQQILREGYGEGTVLTNGQAWGFAELLWPLVAPGTLLPGLLKEARKIIRASSSSSRNLGRDWDTRATDAIAEGEKK